MNLFRATLTAVRKNLTSAVFWGCGALTVVICLCGSVYKDVQTDISYTVFTAIMQISRQEMCQLPELSFYNVLQNASGGWLPMFIPILAALPVMVQVCDESEGLVRMAITRSDRISFFASRVFTGMLVGGLSILVGYLVFAGIIYVFFPRMGEYPAQNQEYFASIFKNNSPFGANWGEGQWMLLRLLEVFLYGAVWALPALLCTVVTVNKYLVVCLPFLVKYLADQICTRMTLQAYADWENPDLFMARVANIVSPNGIFRVFSAGADMGWIFLFNGVMALLAAAAYILLQNGRLDCGA